MKRVVAIAVAASLFFSVSFASPKPARADGLVNGMTGTVVGIILTGLLINALYDTAKSAFEAGVNYFWNQPQSCPIP